MDFSMKLAFFIVIILLFPLQSFGENFCNSTPSIVPEEIDEINRGIYEEEIDETLLCEKGKVQQTEICKCYRNQFSIMRNDKYNEVVQNIFSDFLKENEVKRLFKDLSDLSYLTAFMNHNIKDYSENIESNLCGTESVKEIYKKNLRDSNLCSEGIVNVLLPIMKNWGALSVEKGITSNPSDGLDEAIDSFFNPRNFGQYEESTKSFFSIFDDLQKGEISKSQNNQKWQEFLDVYKIYFELTPEKLNKMTNDQKSQLQLKVESVYSNFFHNPIFENLSHELDSEKTILNTESIELNNSVKKFKGDQVFNKVDDFFRDLGESEKLEESFVKFFKENFEDKEENLCHKAKNILDLWCNPSKKQFLKGFFDSYIQIKLPEVSDRNQRVILNEFVCNGNLNFLGEGKVHERQDIESTWNLSSDVKESAKKKAKKSYSLNSSLYRRSPSEPIDIVDRNDSSSQLPSSMKSLNSQNLIDKPVFDSEDKSSISSSHSRSPSSVSSREQNYTQETKLAREYENLEKRRNEILDPSGAKNKNSVESRFGNISNGKNEELEKIQKEMKDLRSKMEELKSENNKLKKSQETPKKKDIAENTKVHSSAQMKSVPIKTTGVRSHASTVKNSSVPISNVSPSQQSFSLPVSQNDSNSEANSVPSKVKADAGGKNKPSSKNEKINFLKDYEEKALIIEDGPQSKKLDEVLSLKVQEYIKNQVKDGEKELPKNTVLILFNTGKMKEFKSERDLTLKDISKVMAVNFSFDENGNIAYTLKEIEKTNAKEFENSLKDQFDYFGEFNKMLDSSLSKGKRKKSH